MVLNDSSLTSQKYGLSNSLNLTNQDFYVRLVDEKNKENNSVLAGRPSPSRTHFDFSPFLRLVGPERTESDAILEREPHSRVCAVAQ